MSIHDQSNVVSNLSDLSAVDLYELVKYVIDWAEDAEKPTSREEWTICIAQLAAAWLEARS